LQPIETSILLGLNNDISPALENGFFTFG